MDPRMDRLNEPHARPLMELIRSWVTGERKFPNVDPNDGGVNARVLFLQHTPGRMPLSQASSHGTIETQPQRTRAKPLIMPVLREPITCAGTWFPITSALRSKTGRPAPGRCEKPRPIPRPL